MGSKRPRDPASINKGETSLRRNSHWLPYVLAHLHKYKCVPTHVHTYTSVTYTHAHSQMNHLYNFLGSQFQCFYTHSFRTTYHLYAKDFSAKVGEGRFHLTIYLATYEFLPWRSKSQKLSMLLHHHWSLSQCLRGDQNKQSRQCWPEDTELMSAYCDGNVDEGRKGGRPPKYTSKNLLSSWNRGQDSMEIYYEE